MFHGINEFYLRQNLSNSVNHYQQNIVLSTTTNVHVDGLVQERRNSSPLTIGLRLSCTNP